MRKNYKDNNFISDLTIDTKRNSITGIEYPYVKMNFNMNSINEKNKNENAEIIFNGIKEGFEDLKLKTVFGNNLWDMFAVYNILINKNGFGSGTFTKLFQSTSYVEDTDAQFYQFMQFEG